MRTRLLLLCVAGLATLFAIGGAGSASAASTCVGAAARDAAHPCVNQSRSVTPSVKNVNKKTESACNYRIEQELQFCFFGTVGKKAKGNIALLGDSHAWHWRGALGTIAKHYHWTGYSLTGPGCSYSDAVVLLPAGLKETCIPWYAKAKAFLQRHKEISTVFVSQLNSTPLDVPQGLTPEAVRTAAFEKSWVKDLPKNIKHVVVISDIPVPRQDLFTCIATAVGSPGVFPGPACATPRADGLPLPDVGLAAVAALKKKRYQGIDMTPWFCDDTSCPAVIGGTMVYRDTEGHMTPAYSESLGPYLLRAFRALKKTW